jgi:hypothetical protein
MIVFARSQVFLRAAFASVSPFRSRELQAKLSRLLEITDAAVLDKELSDMMQRPSTNLIELSA